MKINWLDVEKLSFNVMMLLDRIQLSWLPGIIPESELAVALIGNPEVEWFMRHKNPELNEWIDKVIQKEVNSDNLKKDDIRRAEIIVMQAINDMLVYVVDPAAYDEQPFLGWDSEELLSLVDFKQKTVIDIGAGTGRLTFTIASLAKHVFAIEPVTNLRDYIREKASKRDLHNVYTLDGLLTQIPLHDNFADVTMAGHVFGEQPEKEYQEMLRVTKLGGMIILCPGNNDNDNSTHDFLISNDFEWSRFEEPSDGMKRKYWKTLRI
jgi:SAM-dependent methyltransferase